ncbi:early nodulin-like protein 17 [Syzygium oleosum]|uniref:early nodulin-like protein 17 n=1 Tax=Syzygium oleosum TaxID=219896 RepID=UPI0024BBE742|nr:early nodulin-like protein 17 [Syzygium oleosum]
MGRVATLAGVAVVLSLAAVMLPGVAAVRYLVGKDMGESGNAWTTNVNYTVWAQNKHFYNGDWLFFVYDRNQLNVLEVNETGYESCDSNHPLVNWTTGKGRDVVPLNVTRPYYFISGNGYCYGGAKLAINVENPPPPPVAAPVKSGSPASFYRGRIILPAVFAVGAMWDTFLRFC